MKKFLCDQMCANLGKWLRIAGYDTIHANPSWTDQEILDHAIKEGRYLLTKDRQFLKMDHERKTTIYLKQEFLEGWAQKLAEEGIVNWLYRPFSRCLHCNELLEKSEAPQGYEKIKETVKEFWICPKCHQVFWQGSHTEHMLATLKKWSEKCR